MPAAASLMRCEVSGPLVLKSIQSWPSLAPSMTPSAPRNTSSQTGGMGRQAHTTSTFAAISAGVLAASPPAATKSSTLPRLRL